MNAHTWLAAATLAAAATISGAGCTRHTVRVEPIEVRPIHMTVDINIKVDRELDQFFDFEDEFEVDDEAAATAEPDRPVKQGG